MYSELKEPEDVAVYAKGSQLAVADTGNYIISEILIDLLCIKTNHIF